MTDDTRNEYGAAAVPAAEIHRRPAADSSLGSQRRRFAVHDVRN
jgi:hypothetical protein